MDFNNQSNNDDNNLNNRIFMMMIKAECGKSLSLNLIEKDILILFILDHIKIYFFVLIQQQTKEKQI